MNLLAVGRIQLTSYRLNQHTNTDERLRETRDFISTALSTRLFKKAVIADSSGIEILSSNELDELRERYQVEIEQHSYTSEDIFDCGKGIKSSSELANIQRVLRGSTLLSDTDYVCKITPRYNILNLAEILRARGNAGCLFYDYHVGPLSRYKKALMTAFFVEEVHKLKALDLEACLSFLNEPNRVYIEHLMYEVMRPAARIYIRCPFPEIDTTGGSSGKKYSHTYPNVRRMMSASGLLAFTTRSSLRNLSTK